MGVNKEAQLRAGAATACTLTPTRAAALRTAQDAEKAVIQSSGIKQRANLRLI